MTVDVPELEIVANGTTIFAPIAAVGITPITLLPTPVDPVLVVVPVGMVAPVDPARMFVPEVAGEITPALAPTDVAPVDDVGDTAEVVGDTVDVVGDIAKDVCDTADDVGDIVKDGGDTVEDAGGTVVVAGIVVDGEAVAGVALEVEVPAPFPTPEELNASSSWQEASASATRTRLIALKTVSTTNLLYRPKPVERWCSTRSLGLVRRFLKPAQVPCGTLRVKEKADRSD